MCDASSLDHALRALKSSYPWHVKIAKADLKMTQDAAIIRDMKPAQLP